ncbi:ATP-binding protein, partial [Brevundimonas sp.]|uniref:ATP-binding protein n=1 Tax=Brevundimonas sp. TaxID=1871086 RepID=UPI0025BD3F70
MRVGTGLDARLQRDVEHPVVLALSGGGDSMALLHIAADWASRNGRRLLAVTVDHGLNPDSPRWSEACRCACEALNVAWTERRWTGDKPSTGLPA